VIDNEDYFEDNFERIDRNSSKDAVNAPSGINEINLLSTKISL